MAEKITLSLVSLFWGVVSLGTAILTAKFLAALRPPSFSTAKRLGYIDGLRGLLALGVFLHHYMATYYFCLTGVWAWTPYRFFNLSAQVGVALFFSITGFLFGQRLFSQQGKINWRQLYLSRIFRLFPLHWFAVLLVLFVVIHQSHYQLEVPPLIFLSRAMEWFALQRFLDINNFKNTWHICANVLWTLRYEWLFYLSLPLLAFIIRLSRRSSWPLWIAAGGVVVLAKLDRHGFGFSTGYFVFFVTGVLCAAAHGMEAWQRVAKKRSSFVVSIAAILLLGVCFQNAYGIKQALLLSLFFFPIALGNPSFRFLGHPALLLLGEISYSIYLLHGILLYAIFSVFLPRLINSAISPAILWGTMPAMAFFTVLVSFFTFSLIENPCMRIGKKIARSESARAGCAAEPRRVNV